MDFRPSSDVADLTLDKDLRIDGLEGFNGLFRLADFSSNGSADRSKTTESKPAVATSRACASEWVWSGVQEDWIIELLS